MTTPTIERPVPTERQKAQHRERVLLARAERQDETHDRERVGAS